MESTETFELVPTKQYKKCREKLDERHVSDLDDVLNELEKKPHPPLVKPLKGKLEGKYVIRFANQSHRLVIKINWNSKSIMLLYLASRALAYTGKMW